MDSQETFVDPIAQRSTLRAWLVRIALVLTSAVFGYLVSQPSDAWLSVPSDDFIQYWAAGRLNALGANPYSPDEAFSLEKEVGLSDEWQRASGRRLDQGIIMWNPPLTLSIAMPFGLLEFPLSRRIWLLFHLLLILCCADWLWCFYGGSNRWRWLAWVLAISFYPTIVIVASGQITALVLLSMIGFLHFERRGNGWAAGAFAAMAAIKPHLVYLLWPALILWAIHGRRWSVLLGCAATGLVATLIPLACNPAVIQEYWYALCNLRTPADLLSPTLGTLLRLGFGQDKVWLHLVSPVLGMLWLLSYWLKNRQNWVWAECLPLLLLVSFLTSAYCAWTCDRVVLLVPVVQAAVWIVQSRRWPAKASAFALYLTIDLLAPAMYYLESSSDLGWERLDVAFMELSLGWMTPALLLGYLLLRWQKNHGADQSWKRPVIAEPVR